MNWIRFLLAVVASGFVGMFTDWFFMGILFHNKSLAAPEMWRKSPGQSETPYILASTILGVVSSVGLILLFSVASVLGSFRGTLSVASLAWLAGPLPLLASNTIWTKLHPLTASSHAFGWLVRFLVTAAFAAWLLG